MSQEAIDARPAEDDALERALEILSEHFEAVLLLASTTRSDDGGTTLRCLRKGNYYASKGMAVEFMENSQAKEIAQAIQATEDDE